MAPILQLLLELSILITAAKLAGLISIRLGQPAVLGEILVGLLLGPSLIHLPGWAIFTSPELPEVINEVAEIGVIFLMFLAGLEADLDQMRRSGRVVVLAGVLGVIVPLLMGFATALPFNYTLVQSIAIGLLLTATSVSISAQTLLELGVLRSKEGIALLGAAVVDDVLVILLLSVFVALATGSGDGTIGLLELIVRVLLFLVIFSVAGWFLIPPLLNKIDTLPISQGVLAGAVVLAFFYAWSAEVIGEVAMITGAFMAGIFAGRSRVHHRIFEGISALTYGFFVPIFFVNIGLHADVGALRGDMVLLTVILTVVAVFSKVIGCGLGALGGGFNRGQSLRLGIGMISRGEVGLIVAQLLVASLIVPDDIITVAVIVVLVTTLVTPPLLRAAFAGRRATAAVSGE